MIRPAIQALSSALLIALGPFLYVFGLRGFMLLGLRLHAENVPELLEQVLAVAAVCLGLYISAGLAAADPKWSRRFWRLTGVLLVGVGVLFLAVYRGPWIR
jgi:hypothetical protein